MKRYFSFAVSLVIVGSSAVAAISIIAHAEDAAVTAASDQSGSAQGISFPVPELGGCTSKEECKTYCNNPANITACVAFAKAHGLMNKDEAARAEKFSQTLQQGGGPGGCTTPDSCKSFCSDLKNIEACVAFAEKSGIKDNNIEQAKKINTFLKSGGQTPGGCSSKEACEKYCGDFSHAEECFNFARKAGIAQGGSAGTGSGGENSGPQSDAQFQKFLELAKSGQTPGGCTSKDACESYCKDSSHREECVAFGEKAGFLNSDQAQKIRESGGAGPGGCTSAESCHAYCADPSHQGECYKFAEDHGFISKEQSQQAQQGQVSLRAGLEQAPPEVAECLQSTLGADTIQNIQSGNLTPDSGVGSQVKDCFEKFGRRDNPTTMFNHMPPDVLACVKEKLGSDFDGVSSGTAQPTPQMGDAVRVCFQAQQFMQQENQNAGQNGNQNQGDQGSGGQNGFQNSGPGGGFAPPQGTSSSQPGGNFGRPQGGQHGQGFNNFIRSAPPGVSSCLSEKLGSEFDALKSGDTAGLSADAKTAVRGCLQSFNPNQQQNQNGSNGMQGEGEGQGQIPPGGMRPRMDGQGQSGSSTRPFFSPGVHDGQGQNGFQDQPNGRGSSGQQGRPFFGGGSGSSTPGQFQNSGQFDRGQFQGGQGQNPFGADQGGAQNQNRMVPGGQFQNQQNFGGQQGQFQNSFGGEQQPSNGGQFQTGGQFQPNGSNVGQPSGGMMQPPPGGSTMPSGGFIPSGGSPPPSGGGSTPPPPPTSLRLHGSTQQASILGTLLGPLLQFLGQ